jgi:hypothetical protein
MNAEHAKVLDALLSVSDQETRAMFARMVAFRRLQQDCPHADGWKCAGEVAPWLWTCVSCGLLVDEKEMDRRVRSVPAPVVPDAEALGTALAAWSPP